jgi:hypothetical protein
MSSVSFFWDAARIALATLGFVIAIAVFHIGWRIMKGDPNEYERNRQRVKSFKNTVHGTIPTKYDGGRDDKIAAGIAVKNGQWIEQGRLSDEALRDVLG